MGGSSSKTEKHPDFKLPIFWENNPTIWFIQAEAQFKFYNIEEDERKYSFTVEALPPETRASINNIISNPPQTDQYNTLKTTLLNRYSILKSKCFETLLEKEILINNNPSELFYQMKHLAGTSYEDVIIKNIWLKHLPCAIYITLKSMEDKPLDELLVLADQMKLLTNSHNLDLTNLEHLTSTPEQQCNKNTNIKLPNFLESNPSIWFIQVEALFKFYNIEEDERKYSLILEALPPEKRASINNIISNPPQTDQYNTLKTTLLNRYSILESKCFEALLQKEILINNNPSELFYQMKHLAGTSYEDEIIKNVWLKHLPSAVYITLKSMEDKPLNEILALADQMQVLTNLPDIKLTYLESSTSTPEQQTNKNTNFKLPTFSESNPSIWFIVVEALFKFCNIDKDERKFCLTVEALTHKSCDLVIDIISYPPQSDQYNTLKTTLLNRYLISKTKHFEALLEKKELNNYNPSELFRQMKYLAKNSYEENIIKNLWLERLPNIINITVKSIEDKPLEELLAIADQINEATNCTKVTQESSNVNPSNAEINATTDETQNLFLEELPNDNNCNNKIKYGVSRRSKLKKSRSEKSPNELLAHTDQFKKTRRPRNPKSKNSASENSRNELLTFTDQIQEGTNLTGFNATISGQNNRGIPRSQKFSSKEELLDNINRNRILGYRRPRNLKSKSSGSEKSLNESLTFGNQIQEDTNSTDFDATIEFQKNKGIPRSQKFSSKQELLDNINCNKQINYRGSRNWKSKSSGSEKSINESLTLTNQIQDDTNSTSFDTTTGGQKNRGIPRSQKFSSKKELLDNINCNEKLNYRRSRNLKGKNAAGSEKSLPDLLTFADQIQEGTHSPNFSDDWVNANQKNSSASFSNAKINASRKRKEKDKRKRSENLSKIEEILNDVNFNIKIKLSDFNVLETQESCSETESSSSQQIYLCYFHQKYGNEAQECIKPCSFDLNFVSCNSSTDSDNQIDDVDLKKDVPFAWE